MASATQPAAALTAAEAAKRRRALESAIGSMRLSGIELEREEIAVMERHVRGETDLATMHAEMDALIESDL